MNPSPPWFPFPRHAFARVLLIVGLMVTLWPRPVAAQSPDDDPDPDATRVIQLITRLTGERPFQTTRIYDRRGKVLAELAPQGRRTIVGYNDIPSCLIQATIATEDRRFWQHRGVDYLAIARATWQNAQSNRIISGGSTLTQQLARLLFLSPEERYQQTLERKLREADLALYLETYYTKKEILTMYLNVAYYGHGAYGVAAAAETYFDKPLDQLNVAECALLAGLPQSPALYDPFRHPEAARQRQRDVLSLMVRAGYLTPRQAQIAGRQPLLFRPPRPRPLLAPHFVTYVQGWIIERYGTKALTQGLQVHTSLDMRYQTMAETIARAQVKAVGKKYRFNNAAVVILNPTTAEILAMVGSIDFNNEAIDGQVNMTTALRQPGSSIKPVIYAAAFERGWDPAFVIWDLPVSYTMSHGRRYLPHNITGRNYGPVRLRMALANSLNIPAIKLLEQVGIPAALETARALGIQSWRKPAQDYGLSLAVGGYEVSLLELTHAYATLAHQGIYTPLHPILLIRDGAGQILYQARPRAEQRQAVSPVTAYQIASVLSDAAARRTMFPSPSPLEVSHTAAVKTGTTDGWRDNLTVGFTPYLAVGVWTGNANGRPMRRAVGFYTAAPIWHDIMEAVWAHPEWHDTLGYGGQPLVDEFPRPKEAITLPVCYWTPGKFQPGCPRMAPEVFSAQALGTTTLPGGRSQGYCLPTSAINAPPSAYFLPLPRRKDQATRARSWIQTRYALTARPLNRCDRTTVQRPLIQQPPKPRPRQWVRVPPEQKRSLSSPLVPIASTP